MNAKTEMKQLYTPWTRNVDPENVLPEYPRPQLQRSGWVNLNGLWDYAFTSVGVTPFKCKGIPAGAAAIARYPFQSDGKILVPFSPESLLSGVQRQLQPDEILWYHRTFHLCVPTPKNEDPPRSVSEGTALAAHNAFTAESVSASGRTSADRHTTAQRTLLHFGAADQFAAVYVNGYKAGTHLGGYLPFTVDITPYLQEDGENDLLVGIRDVSDTSYHARGKQKLERGGMYYTATSGIWQTVWTETVPETYIQEVLVNAAPKPPVRQPLANTAPKPPVRQPLANTAPKPPVNRIPSKSADPDNTDSVSHGRLRSGTDELPCFTITIRASKPGVPVKLRIFRPGIYNGQEFSHTREASICSGSCISGSAFSSAMPPEQAGSSSSSVPAFLTELTVIAGTPAPLTMPEENAKLWSPEEPWLYYFTAEIMDAPAGSTDAGPYCAAAYASAVTAENAAAVTAAADTFDSSACSDRVTGYFALRTVCVRPDEAGIARIYLNGRPYFQRGVLDQGYWPDGLYTPPCDEAFIFDITEMKKTGFNMIRKHAKIEADRWYYHCDRLGLLVWQDMVNGGVPYKDWFVTYLATFTSWVGLHFKDSHHGMLSRKNETGRLEFERDMLDTVNALRAHPSIICWVLFNEGWGQFDTARLTDILRKTDGTRLIDSASGWYDQGCGDFKSTHFYFFTYHLRPEKMRAAVLSEVGGYALHLPGHAMLEKVYGYRQDETKEALAERFGALIRWMDGLREKGLCGYVYTQVSDIEEEVNGIFTYDRQIRKLPESLNTGCAPSPRSTSRL